MRVSALWITSSISDFQSEFKRRADALGENFNGFGVFACASSLHASLPVKKPQGTPVRCAAAVSYP